MERKEFELAKEEISSLRLVLAAITLFLTSLALTLSFGILNESGFLELIKYSVYTILGNLAVLFYLYQNQKKVLKKRYSWWFISFCYLMTAGSVFLLQIPRFLVFDVSIEMKKLPVWILGVALLARFIDANLAVLLSFGMVMFTYYGSATYEVPMIPLVLSIMICFLVKYLTGWISFLYVLLVTVSLFITMLVTQGDFSLDELLTNENISYYACVFLILLISFLSGSISKLISDRKQVNTFSQAKDKEVLISGIERKNEGSLKEENNDFTTVTLEEGFLQQEGLQDGNKLCFSVQEVANLRFSLMKRLEEESPKLYLHSKSIAYLSQKAAECVGARKEVAFAGGLYHEIGRLLGSDYVKNGEELATQYKLPKEVGDMIRQHNFKVELPKTKEAAIVMLSDNILSTILYLQNSGETNITAEKVIENTFSIRLNKGTLDECGLSLKEFHKLKEFYLSNIGNIALQKFEV